jgi:ubiquitin carboxyl-terminal hydrolase 4/11
LTILTFAGNDVEPEPEYPTEPVPLIRLGEGILCDWDLDTVQSLFSEEKLADDDLRGRSTWHDPRITLPDPALVRKQELRKSRKRDGISLEDCLEEFGKEEILSANDAWYCPRCKEHRRASKKFELWKVPDILVIHLKRFSAQGRLRDKLDVNVEFPIEGLDLTKRVADHEGKELLYDLFAVDNHYGGLGGGHYTAYARNFFDGCWYDYNGEFDSGPLSTC